MSEESGKERGGGSMSKVNEYHPSYLKIIFPGGHEVGYTSKDYVWDINHELGVVTIWERAGSTRTRISGWVAVIEYSRKGEKA
jgi:hypothetical protein